MQAKDDGPWPPGFRDQLPEQPTRRIIAQQGAVNAAAAARTEDGPLVYCVGQTGTLKIYSMDSGAQVLYISCITEQLERRSYLGGDF